MLFAAVCDHLGLGFWASDVEGPEECSAVILEFRDGTVLYHSPGHHIPQNSTGRSVHGVSDTRGPPPVPAGSKHRGSSPSGVSPPGEGTRVSLSYKLPMLLPVVGCVDQIGASGPEETGVPRPLPHCFLSRSKHTGLREL